MKMIKRTIRERLFATPWRPLDTHRMPTEVERMTERSQQARTTAQGLGVSSIDPLLTPRGRERQSPDRFGVPVEAFQRAGEAVRKFGCTADDLNRSLSINPMWGKFDERGCWQHNPNLKMSRDEQYADNIKRGISMSPRVL